MTGVKAPAAVLGASVVATQPKGPLAGVLGAHAAKATLPFTGIALGAYLAIGVSLVLAGLVLRALGRVRA